jgi:hypothetical protein
MRTIEGELSANILRGWPVAFVVVKGPAVRYLAHFVRMGG